MFCLSFCYAMLPLWWHFLYFQQEGGGIEMNIIWFFAGIMIGSMVGVVLMCLLQINRHNPENKQQ